MQDYICRKLNIPLCFLRKSQRLWQQLECRIQTRTGFYVHFHPEVLQEYLEKNPNSIAINTLIIATKSYIYSKSRKSSPINIAGLLHCVKTFYSKQSLLALVESIVISLRNVGSKWREFFKVKLYLLSILTY